MKQISDMGTVFLIHLARLRAEAGPFLLAAIVFPLAMYLFATGVAAQEGHEHLPSNEKLRFIAASIVFSISLTAISWFGYLILENRFTGRLKLFATLPVAPSSYVGGVLIFAVIQGLTGSFSLLIGARLLGVQIALPDVRGFLSLIVIVVVSVLSLSGVSLVIASRARSFSAGSLMTDAIGGGIVLIAPVYYPAESLPMALQGLSVILPTTYMARGVISVLNGRSGIEDIMILCGFAAATLSIGLWQMKWREN